MGSEDVMIVHLYRWSSNLALTFEWTHKTKCICVLVQVLETHMSIRNELRLRWSVWLISCSEDIASLPTAVTKGCCVVWELMKKRRGGGLRKKQFCSCVSHWNASRVCLTGQYSTAAVHTGLGVKPCGFLQDKQKKYLNVCADRQSKKGYVSSCTCPVGVFHLHTDVPGPTRGWS